jgi:hypothetical protein
LLIWAGFQYIGGRGGSISGSGLLFLDISYLDVLPLLVSSSASLPHHHSLPDLLFLHVLPLCYHLQ